MTEPLPDTWHSRELPVLRDLIRQLDGGHASPEAAATRLGISKEEAQRATRRLVQAAYVTPLRGATAAGGNILYIAAASREALQASGVWPTPETALDRMIAALQAIAENTDQDEDTRTRARKLLDGLTGAGKTMGISVATAAITGQLPGAGT